MGSMIHYDAAWFFFLLLWLLHYCMQPMIIVIWICKMCLKPQIHLTLQLYLHCATPPLSKGCIFLLTSIPYVFSVHLPGIHACTQLTYFCNQTFRLRMQPFLISVLHRPVSVCGESSPWCSCEPSEQSHTKGTVTLLKVNLGQISERPAGPSGSKDTRRGNAVQDSQKLLFGWGWAQKTY